jgi:hypothetical protein
MLSYFKLVSLLAGLGLEGCRLASGADGSSAAAAVLVPCGLWQAVASGAAHPSRWVDTQQGM